jgi:AraC-like DNA-binding protein
VKPASQVRKTLAVLQAAARRLPCERYVVDRPVDEQGQYQLELTADFPFAIKRLRFDASQPRPPLTWHAYQELFLPLSGGCRVQMGEALIELGSGDVLVMDHLKLHAIVDFPRRELEVAVIRFMPEIIHRAGSVASEHLILLPFYCQVEGQPHVLRANHADAAEVQLTLARMLESYAGLNQSPYATSGARVYFQVLLYHLARHFHAAEELLDRFARQQAQVGRMRRVFAYINQHYAERISLPEMAARAGLSRAQFYRMFKRAAGMGLVDYVAQVRLTQAARMLQETDLSVAEIASTTGFADQSYFDRRFRRRYGRTPRLFRQAALPPALPTARQDPEPRSDHA